MITASAHDTDWAEANKRCLMAELDLVRRALEHHAGGGPASDGASERDCQGAGSLFAEAEAVLPAPSALSHLCRAFALSRFERSVLLLAAGVELDASFAGACARAQGGGQRPFPTFGLALAALPEPHWDALAPSAPLRRWRMLEPAAGENLVDARLRIDERILHHLTGISYLDERLQGLIQPLGTAAGLVPSQEACAERTAAILQRHHEKHRLPVINLCGLDPNDLRGVAARACSRLGLRAFLLEAAGIPGSQTERDVFARLWEREAILSQAGLILAADEGQACRDFLDLLGGVLLVASRDPLGSSSRLVVRLDVAGPSVAEQRELWQAALPKGPEALNGTLDRVVAHFRLNSRAIQSACAQLEEASAAGSSDSLARRLWTACRVQARQRLDELAQRLEPAARWEDIVLPDRHLHTLREIAAQVRHRTTVYHTWGFARKCPRGLGITALFAGPSGTGKTMAAE
ncbi:MAG TPA: hypothetical protein VMN36_17510, partial [Verrucomicrobiales bacterium]|nr:hypothetical protein [Verrucomicrobiales bacterium]